MNGKTHSTAISASTRNSTTLAAKLCQSSLHDCRKLILMTATMTSETVYAPNLPLDGFIRSHFASDVGGFHAFADGESTRNAAR